MKDWQGHVHYHSPRQAESWNAPTSHQLCFEQAPVGDAMQVLAEYRAEVLKDVAGKPAAHVFAERRARVLADVVNAQDTREDRLYASEGEEEEADPYLDFDDAAAKARKKGWLRRLFSRS